MQTVREAVEPWQDEHQNHILPWFRGMARVSWMLEPSLLRGETGVRERSKSNPLTAEEQRLDHFRARGIELVGQQDADKVRLMCLAQHHGFPTRLLDWSENALAALFFAVREREFFNDKEPAVVWMFDSYQLSARAGTGAIKHADSTLLSGSFNMPVPLFPYYSAPRIGAQRGAFTLHGFSPEEALVKIALKQKSDGEIPFLQGIMVQPTLREQIRADLLAAYGCGEFTFFPDLDGLARELKVRFELED